MLAGVVGCEPHGPFKAKEDEKTSVNIYCKFIEGHFMEWLYGPFLA